MPRASVRALACVLLLGGCSAAPEYRVTGVGSLSGVSVSDGRDTRFVAFSGIVAEPLYADPRYGAACRLAEARDFAVRSLSGGVVSIADGGVRLGGEPFEVALARAGYAVPDPFSPGILRGELAAAAVEAREASRGIWDPCPRTPAAADVGATLPDDPAIAVSADDPPATDAESAARKEPPAAAPAASTEKPPVSEPVPMPSSGASGDFSCDPARRTCKAMKSCAEAKYFLANCGAKGMDGDKDGVPCESLCKGK